MSIPESVIREMKSFHRDSCYPECSNDSASDAARRVILALAENLPPESIIVALNTYFAEHPKEGQNFKMRRMHTAIAAFLKHVAGETP